MELRVLQYFLAVAREESISKAAQSLHLSQPTLSRQLMDLELELGKTLMIRGNRKITLTEEGLYLRKRAQEILDLVQKTENEFSASDEMITGDVYIGAGETDGVRLIAKTTKKLQTVFPDVRLHIISDDSCDIVEQLDKGLIDFGLVLGPIDFAKYNYLTLPMQDHWGMLMLKTSPLAQKEWIERDDCISLPLILSRQATCADYLGKWMNTPLDHLNVVATYNLIFNGSLLVEEGLGYALTIDKLINTSGTSPLCFRLLKPDVQLELSLIWKKYQVFSRAATKFLEYFQLNLTNLQD